MKQVVTDRPGQVRVRDVQKPSLRANGVLTQTLYSVISTGTEAWTVRRTSDRGEQPLQIIGHSNCGQVLEVGPACAKPVEAGGLVACSGMEMATHGEYCSVPRNMFAPVPNGVGADEAAFTTLGCNSLHGVRQGRIALGDKVVVLGTGPIAQMAAQLARLNGGRVIVVGHRNEKRLELARRLGAEKVLLGSAVDPVDAVLHYTNGLGADVVLMCAAPKASGMMGQCLDMVRKNGRIVVVGLAELDFPFVQWQRKEAELLISRAYGPGRHDPSYEEEGIDYPSNYVRWTLNRNMEEFLQLLAEKRVDVKSLISHIFPIEDAKKAFDVVLNEPDEVISVVLKYGG